MSGISDELVDPSGDLQADSADGGGEDKLQKENARLAGRVSELQEMNQKALPWVQLAKKLESTEGGKEILRKLAAGEPLTAGDKKKAASGDDAPLTRGELEKMLDEHRKQISEDRFIDSKARDNRIELEKWASEEFEGYDEIRNSPGWERRFQMVASRILEDVETQVVEIPKEFGGDPWKWIVSETMDWVKAQNPEFGKARKVRKSDDELEADKLAASSKRGSGSPTEGSDDDNLPDEVKTSINRIRNATKSRVAGTRFSG